MSGIREWLDELGLGQYVQAFEANDIDLALLPEVNDQVLKDIGIASAGHRLKILAGIRARVPALAASATVAAQIAPSHSALGSTGSDGERRQLTVLFCDMVGYTELTSRVDPEVLQGIVRRYEDACAVCITRYEGYVFQRLGDGIVAFFGYPLAHEGEAERAIRAGLEILESLAKLELADAGRLQVRIGIATGLVVVSSAEKGAVGETMNLAARLQAIASPGSIVVSERVRRLAGGVFDYQDLGAQTLKGIAEPTHAYRILGMSEAASRFDAATGESLTPMVGREQELALLLERWQLAQDGEGQVVLLSGEPGIGKSRILSALRERLEAQGAQALRFQCSPYYVNSALWPSIDNFERALKFARDESPESKLDKLEALIVNHYGRPRSEVPYVAALLSVPSEERYGAVSMTPQRRKDETIRTLVDLTEAAARKEPSVMLVEDVHWADPTTLEVMDLLIDRVKSFPLLIVLTHRPEFQSRWSEHGHVAALNLSKLTRAQSAAMILRLADGKALPAELLDEILTKTDGVPLFVEELTKSVLESGELKDAGERYEYAGATHGISIPTTLRDSLMARLDRFMPVKEIAQIGAAIGREFSYELVAAVAPMHRGQVDSALTQLTDSGLAFRRGTPPDAVYTFKHALVQDAAYDSLLKSRRQVLHAKIAAVIEERYPEVREVEPEVLAQHYTRAAMPAEAATLWHRAGSIAVGKSTLPDAIAHLTHGLEACEAIADATTKRRWRLELLTTRGIAYMAMKGWPAAEVGENLSPALPLAREQNRSDLLVPILAGLFWNKHNPGPVRASLRLVDEAFGEARSRNDIDLELVAHMLAVSAHYWIGNLTEVVTHTNRLLEIYEIEHGQRIQAMLSHDPKVVAHMHCTQALWMLGCPDQALRMFDENDAHARQLGNYFDHGVSLTFGAIMLGFRRDVERLNVIVNRAIQIAREQRLPVIEHLMAAWVRADAFEHSGRSHEHLRERRQFIEVWMSIGGGVGIPYHRSRCAHTLAQMGEVDQALDYLAQSLEQIERPEWGERVHLAEVLRIKGVVLARKGDSEAAEKNYLASLDWAREQQAKSWELRTSTSLARLWQSQDKRTEAYEMLAPVYNWFTEGFDTKDLKEAKALISELETVA
jgi:class 3 adenylate cyclase/tetratricopeptide (TPR) repeat protein